MLLGAWGRITRRGRIERVSAWAGSWVIRGGVESLRPVWIDSVSGVVR
jgi:hypothetical protein